MQILRLCFDSTVWNALLNNEPNKDVDAIRSWMQFIVDGKAELLVPTIVVSEVYANPDQEVLLQFERLLMRSSIVNIDISQSIGKRSGLLRRKVLNDGKKLKAFDSLIIASAEHYSAKKIFSYDADFLRCNGKYDIQASICKPEDGHDHPLFK